MRQRVRNISVLALSLAIIAGCTDTAPMNPEPVSVGEEQSLKPIKAIKIEKQNIGEPLELTAEVQSSVQFNVIAKSGGDIEKVFKNRGDVVQEGEVIIKLHSDEIKAQRDMAALGVKNAQDAIAKAKERAKKDWEARKQEMVFSVQKIEQSLAELTRNYNKMRNDYDVGLASKNQLHQVEVQLSSMRLDLEQLKQKQNAMEPEVALTDLETQLKNAQFSQEQAEKSASLLEIKAPVSGILTEMPLEAWMTLQPGAMVGMIQKIDPIKIKGYLSEEASKIVSGKTELSYYLQGATQKNKGKISYLSKVIDPEKRAYELNLDVPNKEMALKPGMKVKVLVTDEQDQRVLAIPTYSVIKENESTFVFALVGDTVEKRKVQLGRVNDSYQEVLSGLQEGDKIVITNLNQLKDKEKVILAAGE